MLAPKFLSALLTSLSLFAAIMAQRPCAIPQHERLRGRLRDSCGLGIAKAAITAEGGRIRRKFKSDKEGRFEACLPAGTYKLTVEKYGFKRHIVLDVEVTAESTATVEVDMEVGYASDDPNARDAKPCPPPNNGMHPTADTIVFIFLQRFGAAGDAGH